MVNLSDYAVGGSKSTQKVDPRVSTPISLRDEQRIEQSEEKHLEESRVPFSQVDNISRELDWVSSYLFKDSPEFKPDPEFTITKDHFDTYFKDLPETSHEFLEEATSESHLKHLREQALDEQKKEQEIAKWGWTGTGVRLANNLVDPGAIAVSVASEGTMLPAILASKASRFSKILKSGFIAAGSNAGYEHVLQNYKADQDPWAEAQAAAYGMAFGSLGAGLLTRNKAITNSTKLSRALEKAEIQEAGLELTDKGKKHYGEGEFTPVNELSAGAAQSPYIDRPLSENVDELIDQVKDTPQTVAANARFSLSAQFNRSENPLTRHLGNILVQDGVGKKNGAINTQSVTEWVENQKDRNLVDFYKTFNSNFKTYHKELNGGWSNKETNRRQFNEEVYDYVTGITPEDSVSPSVKSAGNKLRNKFSEMLTLAKNPKHLEGDEIEGVKGFDNIEANPNYVPVNYDARKVQNFTNDFGDLQLERVIANGYKSRNPKLDDLTALKIGKWHLNTVKRIPYAPKQNMSKALNGEDTDKLAEMLEEALGSGELGRKEIDEILSSIKNDKASKSNEGKVKFAKSRSPLDYNIKTEVKDRNGLTVGKFSVSDVLDKNVEHLFTDYSRQMLGHIGLARVGFKSEGQLDTFIKTKLGEVAERKNLNSKSAKDDSRRLEVVKNHILGRPVSLNQGSDLDEFGRNLMAHNRNVRLNQVVFTMMSEVGSTIGAAGLKAYMKQIPSFKKMMKRMENGELEDVAAREMEVAFGVGGDDVLDFQISRFDPEDIRPNNDITKMQKLADKSHKLNVAIMNLTGMLPMDRMLRRAAAKSVAQRFVDIAKGNTKHISSKRLAATGLDQDTYQRILKEINSHAEIGKFNTYKRLNFENWTDLKARERFVAYLARDVGSIVQKEDIGNLTELMVTSRLAKMVVQFKRHPIVAYEKQLLRNGSIRDLRSYNMFMSGFIMAAMGYSARTYLNAQGRDDKNKYLRERLAPESIAKSAFALTPTASLIPTAVDSVLGFTPVDPVFAYSRSSGLGQSISENPSLVSIDNAVGAVKGGIRAATDPNYDYSQEDAKKLKESIILQGYIGVSNVLNNMVADLPKESE